MSKSSELDSDILALDQRSSGAKLNTFFVNAKLVLHLQKNNFEI